ncbi:unnamed protein product [Calicophoron daubneyi]|uniref:Cyclin N-terminal domain-containing protein n=1 Tax=Calicophoron daubneyi TaxID=300641 RepID=A0AAV2TCW2_CALDB
MGNYAIHTPIISGMSFCICHLRASKPRFLRKRSHYFRRLRTPHQSTILDIYLMKSVTKIQPSAACTALSTSEGKTCPKVLQADRQLVPNPVLKTEVSGEGSDLKTRRHTHSWLNGWRRRRSSKDLVKKRSIDDGRPLEGLFSKRRLTADEATHQKVLGKENIEAYFWRKSSTKPQSNVSSDSHGSRLGLADTHNQQSSQEKTEGHGSKLAKFESIRPADHIEKVVNLARLSLSDEIRPATPRPSDDRRELPTFVVEDFSTSSHVSSKRQLNVLQSTRLLGMLFFHPIVALLEKQFKRHTVSHTRLVRFEVTSSGTTPTAEQQSSSLAETSPGGTHKSFVISLPECLPDNAELDEFHENHERIFRYLFARDVEVSSYYNPDFLTQNGLNPDIRSTLCDWMIKVQQYLKLRTETLHLAVSLVDRYTWLQKGMSPADYQLVGITALFVAAKYVERFAPATTALCYLTENSYKPRRVIEFELHLLQVLDFDIGVPLPHHFLTRATLACTDMTPIERAKIELIACYLFELSLTEIAAVGLTASLRCAAAVRLTRQLLRSGRSRQANQPTVDSGLGSNEHAEDLEDWPSSIAQSTGYEDSQKLRAVSLIYLHALKRFQPKLTASREKYEAAFHKFSNRGYRSIAQCETIQNCDFDSLEASLNAPGPSTEPN